MTFSEYCKRIENLLDGDLPGKTAQYKMAPLKRDLSEPLTTKGTKYAGVLILLYPLEEEYYTILIRRTLYNGVHSGQISFPGGKYEFHDRDLITTALRETEEEIGVSSNEIKVIGKLTPLFIPVSNYIVHPVVGVLKSKPSLERNYKEVEEIFSVKLETLTDPRCLIHNDSIYESEHNIEAPYFLYNKFKIWGATAMILSEFIEIHKNTKKQIR
ncbi:MAG: NUDIX hydrolase [Bacteroidota bacterium]